MQFRYSAIGLGVLCALTLSSAHATNGYLSHGYGTKSKGMAGAGMALPQDAMIIVSNVAGVAWLEERLDLGAALFSPSREYTQKSPTNMYPPEAIQAGMAPPWPVPVGSNPDFTGTVESDRDLFLIPHVAYSRPLNDRGSFGVALYGNGGMNTSYNHQDTTKIPGTPAAGGLGTYGGAFGDPPNATAGIDLMQLMLNLSYAHKLTDQFSLGAGLILAYQSFKAQGLQALAPLVADGRADALSNRGRDNVYGWGAQIGALWKPTDQWAIGASYQTKIDFDRFEKYSDLFAEDGDMDAPAVLNAGIAFKPRADLAFAFDVQHILYSDVPAIANDMTTNMLLCMAGQAQHCLGGSQGMGFGWDDMTVYKFGAQWEIVPNDWTIRAGYSYGKQPVPSSGVLFNVLAPGIIEQHFTMGLTKQINKKSEIDLSLMYAPQKDLDCGCLVPASGGPESINIAMDQWEIELNFGYRF
ncbi:MAG: aromatic hydrocarbon degradation protein [Sphingobacteriia bacterium]|nr:aromatic hydrocarbon degradation protein [Sphingobacteriia bacterium]NCC39234.1 aromatic hydrocarbon degradation protein [Gammaproteobacteria bacterium]